MKRFVPWTSVFMAFALAVVGTACRPVNQTTDPGPSNGEPDRAETEDTPTVELPTEAEVLEDEPVEAELADMPVPPLPLDDQQLAEGWIALFDGQTLFGWHAASEANWRVEEGAIVVSSGEKGLLHTNVQFGDYVLRLDFLSEPGTNSGIFLHTPPVPEDPAVDCYEVNIADADDPFPTGSLVGRAKVEDDFNSEQWQTYEITVVGDTITVHLDGQHVLEYTDPEPLRRGNIGLQYNQGRVAFRNIHLKPLELPSLFNGKDLTGWVTYPDMDSRFTVTEDGLLHVEDGRGQLETEQSFGDFVLQLQCKTHAPELNSGIFFRCIPRDIMMGYEFQIHNGIIDGDPRRPVDCGTGGIFRRQDARFVVAEDLQWFYMTMVVTGPHMAAWVNGLQVSDWTDERPPDENPRRGKRLEPGTIIIQGHDPTTDISFREIYAAELAPSRGW